MKGREFVRRARRYARKTGEEIRFDQRRGKGSHGTLYLGNRHTMVKHGEISKGVLATMLKHLGIDRKEF